jgi:hypothetical protein
LQELIDQRGTQSQVVHALEEWRYWERLFGPKDSHGRIRGAQEIDIGYVGIEREIKRLVDEPTDENTGLSNPSVAAPKQPTQIEGGTPKSAVKPQIEMDERMPSSRRWPAMEWTPNRAKAEHLLEPFGLASSLSVVSLASPLSSLPGNPGSSSQVTSAKPKVTKIDIEDLLGRALSVSVSHPWLFLPQNKSVWDGIRLLHSLNASLISWLLRYGDIKDDMFPGVVVNNCAHKSWKRWFEELYNQQPNSFMPLNTLIIGLMCNLPHSAAEEVSDHIHFLRQLALRLILRMATNTHQYE